MSARGGRRRGWVSRQSLRADGRGPVGHDASQRTADGGDVRVGRRLTGRSTCPITPISVGAVTGRDGRGRDEEDGMGALEGKVAIVTGGASGIGLASSRRLDAEGATIVVVDANGDGAEKAAAALGGVAVRADVGKVADWDRIVDAVRRLGGVDIAYLNAGVTTRRGGHHQGHRRAVPADPVGQRRRHRLRHPRPRARARGPRRRSARGHVVAGGDRGLLRRPHLRLDQARRGRVRARPRPRLAQDQASRSTPSAPVWWTRR